MKCLCRLGNAAWGFRRMPLEKQLAATAAMGLSLLELSLGDDESARVPTAADDVAIDQVRSLFHAHAVDLACGSIGNDFTHEDAARNRQELERVKHLIDCASRLGLGAIRIFAGFSPAEAVTGRRWDCMVQCLNMAAEHARVRQVTLAIETHGGVNPAGEGVVHFHSVSTRPDLLARLLQDLDPGLMFNFDPANLWAAGITRPHTVREILGERVSYVHLKDFRPLASGGLVPVGCGEGALNWDEVMGSLTGYRGPAFIEYEVPEDVIDGCRRSLRFLERYV